MVSSEQCLCPRCAPPDTQKPTFSESYKLQAEARLLLSWPLAQRREYLAAKPVQGRRAALEAEMKMQWAARR